MPFLRRLALAALLAACDGGAPPVPPAPPPATEPAAAVPETPSARFAPVDFTDLPGWSEDDLAGLETALGRSCALAARRPTDQAVAPGFGRWGDWAAACAALPAGTQATPQQFRAALEAGFRPWALTAGAEPEGLFTGYYEPLLTGSLTRRAPTQTPLLRRPDELVTVDLGRFRDSQKGERLAGRVEGGQLVPMPDRAAIEAGALNGRGLELVWVDDPIDAFFLHIQGSGAVALAEGGRLRVGYDGWNGHVYRAIGRDLVERGALEREAVSLQSIRAWLRAHPGEAAAVMNLNPSYVFFRRQEQEGAVGAQGVVLTPGRSLAVDRALVPLGVPVWLDAEDPLDPALRLRRLMVAQDTGGAIRGPVRGDVFWGAGPEAEERAGRMKSRGRWWLLLPAVLDPR